MRIESLEAYDVPADIIDVWRRHVGPELLPVQERAVKELGLFGAGNLIVFSPTSSGKTFIGEMAAVQAARANRKVFYLVPQKALAAEKFEELRRRYAPAGIDVVVSSRDHREHDDRIARRDFQIAVVVFEKLRALLVARPQLVKAVGLVVVDELQMLTDPERGPGLELLLTKLRLGGAPRPRIIGLSAVLGRAQALADWLDARLLVETRRPVELRKGVLCRGTFRYLEHNSGREGTETFPDVGAARREELLLSAAEELVRRGEQVLVFVPDRGSTVQLARVLAPRVSVAAAAAAQEELRRFEETHAREALREVLGSGVAFHNADLSAEERELVERWFRAGAVRCLFSTSTLAVGMNLPVKNVVLDGRKWELLGRYGRWSLEDIGKSEYENMSGRAGRLSLVQDFGRSILVTGSPFEAEVWLRHYAASEFEAIHPTLGEAPLEDHVLDALASGLAGTRAELETLLLGSFTGQVRWAQRLSREELAAGVARAVETCVAADLVRRRGERLEVNVVGRACAAKGIGAAAGIALASWARAVADGAAGEVADEGGREAFPQPSELEVLAVAAFSEAGAGVYVGLGKQERYRADHRGELLARAAAAGVAARPVFAALAAEPNAAEYDAAKVIKKVLLLADWIDELPTADLEARYHVWAGALRRIGEEHGWIVDALAAIARACGWPEARAAALDLLAERLTHGVRADALGLARLRRRGVGRAALRRLADAGAPARAADAADMAAEAPADGEAMPGAAPALAPSSPAVPMLTVDLHERRVTYRGVDIPTRPPHNLQRLPLLALAALAARAGQAVALPDLAEEMERLGGLARRLVAPDPRDLRYKLLSPFRRALDGKLTRAELGELDHLVENVAGSGLRLNLPGAARVVGDKQATKKRLPGDLAT